MNLSGALLMGSAVEMSAGRLIDIAPNLSLNLFTIGFYGGLIGVVGESARETPIKQ